MTTIVSIDTMPLYTHLHRIEKGLAALGVGPRDAIRPEQLFPLDQWHYRGTESVRHAAEHLDLNAASTVLDIGSGVGGPARFLAHTIGCHVTALELQPQLDEIATDLTRRCGLTDRVTHLCGDALDHPIADLSFDAVVSWMVIHHILDRPRLCRRIAGALRPGGGCYIEDLYLRQSISGQDLSDVRDILFGKSMSPIDEFINNLRDAGLARVAAIDLTAEVTPFVVARLASWQQDQTSHTRNYGEEAYAALEHFFAVVARLFLDGKIGCVRLTATT